MIVTKTENRQKSHEVKEDHKETHDEQVEEISGAVMHMNLEHVPPISRL